MKGIIFHLLIVITFSTIIFAGSRDSTVVGPGVVYYHEYREGGPWHFNVLKIDLTNQWIKLETVKAQDRLKAFERTSSMAMRNNYTEHHVIGAVNGDFYNTATGEPINTQVINGQILRNPINYVTIGFNAKNKAMINPVNFNGDIIKGDSTVSVSGVNKTRDANQLILYNSYFGNSTGTNSFGTEILISPLNQWIVNDTVNCIVEKKEVSTGNMTLTKGKAVLSGHGISADFLNNNVASGDTIKILLKLQPAIQRLTEMIGGNVKLVDNGIPSNDNGDRHPRTSAGISKDSTFLYLFTVDGRQTGYSVGMSYKELADYMVEWGVYQGINLDGGGSTTMFADGSVVNSPSDPGGERSVANSLLVINTAPPGELSHLRISPAENYVLSNSKVQFSVNGFDQYYNSVTLSPDSINWNCDSELGTIDQNGLFTANNIDSAKGYVYAVSGGIKDSVLVVITFVSTIILQPDPIILEVGQKQIITAEARDGFDNTVNLKSADYEWSVTGGVGTIDSTGLFTAVTAGEGNIIAKYKTVTGSVEVLVGVSSIVILDDFKDVSKFTISGVNINLSGCKLEIDSSVSVSAPSSARLDYSLTTGGTSALYLDCNIRISGTPDAIGLNIYGDGKGHWLRGEFKDVDGERFIIDFTDASPGIDWLNEWKYIEVPFSKAIPSWANPSAVLNFPVTWTRIYLAETSDAKKDNGTIYLDDFKAHFVITDINEELNNTLPGSFKLMQNYPNPFNPATTIKYDLPYNSEVRLIVYNILGQQVKVLVDQVQKAAHYEYNWNASDLASGVYIYILNANSTGWQQNYHSVKKMVLLK